MKELKKISVIGMGLLGASISLAALRAFPSVLVCGFSRRKQTRQKARRLQVAGEIAESLEECVQDADVVIFATPIRTFPVLFEQIRPFVKPSCVITDVGSTKLMAHRWAREIFNSNIAYVGSHPIAGSEKRGVDFARDDLLAGANCILTKTPSTRLSALRLLKKFWERLGCRVLVMTPQRHDRIFGHISHLPHIAAAALVNANSEDILPFAGKGFLDTSRVASGPANIWTDILLTNPRNCIQGIDRLIAELKKIRTAISQQDERKIERLLEKARSKREKMIAAKLKQKELF
ncbi:MAG TPA: prephenate dehydrogenase [Anaerohalosphaeraceae bacterium]|nr:prephenate dehydrogenase [Anaerohalosphaeraceae bacterium]HPP55541.1 prephenate dehydrogenase [Anaerohalosphaeraceae bacterium]